MINAAGGSLRCIASVETIYAVFEDLDKEEGKGGRRLQFATSSRDVAATLAKGRGVYGQSGEIRAVQTLRLEPEDLNAPPVFFPLNHSLALEDLRQARLRAEAVALLTKEQYDALRA